MSVKTFLLPDLGEGLTEAELVKWLVAVGDTIVIDQPIAEVETAKSMVEVPSPYAGTVHELHGAEGEMVLVDTPLFSVVEEGSEAPEAAAEPKVTTPVREVAQSYREEEQAGAKAPEGGGSGNVLIGYGTPEGLSAKSRKRRPRNGGGNAPAQAAQETPAAPRSAPLVISPLVRKLAKERGVDIAALTGSGTGGLILRSDVEAASAAPSTAPVEAAAPAAPSAASAPRAASAAAGELDSRCGLPVASRTPITGVRKTIAQAMTRSRSEIPEATVWVDVDATALLEMRSALKAKDPQNTPGLLAFIARFVVAGLQKYPELNSRIETSAQGDSQIVGFEGINLGIAAQTDRGLMVPAIRNAQQLSARGINAELARLTEVTRAGKATVAELTSGTFTLNNYGVFGVDGSAAIINYPEVAILGVGRIIDRPWVVNGELAVRKVTELTLAFDHRVCDGGVAAGFLRFVADAMENPAGALADL